MSSLPNELFLQIAGYLGHKDLNSFLRVNKLLAVLLSPMLLDLAASKSTVIGLYKRTVLHWAASHNRCSLMTLLLERGISFDTADIYRMVPLHSAAIKGNEAAVKLLLENGASTEATDCDSLTPLHSAVLLGKHAVVKMLLDKGASMDMRNYYLQKGNLLHCAAAMGHLAVVQVLLEGGCKPDVIDDLGLNALQIAAASGHKDMVKWWLNFGGFSSNQLPKPEFIGVPYVTIYGRTKVSKLLFIENDLCSTCSPK